MQLKEYENIKLYHGDCMELLKQTPDNYYSLALVDPPYGINITKECMGGRDTIKPDNSKTWDNYIPKKEYFNELFRISKNQIIWGGNYFSEKLPSSRYFVIWDKGETMYGRDFAECEYAWVRYGGTRIFKKNPNQKNRIHPTQKPIQLYEWLLNNYANKNDKIIDTHLGSGSIAIAIDKANKINNMNLQFTGIEIDEDYYNSMIKRFENYISQLTLNLI